MPILGSQRIFSHFLFLVGSTFFFAAIVSYRSTIPASKEGQPQNVFNGIYWDGIFKILVLSSGLCAYKFPNSQNKLTFQDSFPAICVFRLFNYDQSILIYWHILGVGATLTYLVFVERRYNLRFWQIISMSNIDIDIKSWELTVVLFIMFVSIF